jgi:hypothetical protein
MVFTDFHGYRHGRYPQHSCRQPALLPSTGIIAVRRHLSRNSISLHMTGIRALAAESHLNCQFPTADQAGPDTCGRATWAAKDSIQCGRTRIYGAASTVDSQ